MSKWSTGKRVLIGLGIVGVLFCLAGGGLLFRLDAWMNEELREPLWSARCGDHAVAVEHVRVVNNLEGVTRDRRLEGNIDGRRFGLDGEPEPTFYRWNPTPRHERGEGTDAVHVFVGAGELESGDAEAIERCVEAHADALLRALDDNVHDEHAERVWTGRRRVYWSGTAEDLVARFVDDDRTLELGRDGSLALIESFGAGGTSESWLGDVVEEDGAPRIEWLFRRLEDAELARFVDGEGQTLPARLGLP